jgi:glycosyltransferase involved in cell wall biosynthesis
MTIQNGDHASGVLGSLAGRRLLFLNWRDPAHPSAGGAELYCWEIARRLAAAGARVTVFASQPGGLPARAQVDGVTVVRAGGKFSIYIQAARYLRAHQDPRSSPDAVIDMQNGIPFFAPLSVSANTPVIGVIHHVHQQQFSQHFPWPLSSVGRLLEGPVSRIVYRSSPIVVVSPSTRDAVRRELGFGGPIQIVPNGVEPAARTVARAATPRIAVVTRLVAHKRIGLLVEAIPALLKVFPSLEVDIAGDGPDRPRLQALAATLGVEGAVHFHGRIPDEERTRLLSRGWLTVNPSSGEGWGLSVLESNGLGVPAVVYEVPGSRDSVLPEVTGWLVRDGDPLFAKLHTALRDLADPPTAKRFADRCRAWAHQFSWDRTAERMAAVVLAEFDSAQARRAGERRRGQIDSASVARFDIPHRTMLADPGISLRRTDLVRVEGNRATVLLPGADEHDSLIALQRIQVRGPVDLRLARGIDELTGGAEQAVAPVGRQAS